MIASFIHKFLFTPRLYNYYSLITWCLEILDNGSIRSRKNLKHTEFAHNFGSMSIDAHYSRIQNGRRVCNTFFSIHKSIPFFDLGNYCDYDIGHIFFMTWLGMICLRIRLHVFRIHEYFCFILHK